MRNPNPDCSACEDMHDDFYGSWASPCPVHNEDGSLKAPASRQPEDSEGRKTVSIRCGKEAVFPIDILGGPMREYEPGKWENAVWPSAVSVLNAPVPVGYVLVSEEALRTLGVLDAITTAAVYPRKSDFAIIYPNGGITAAPQLPKT